MGKQIKINILIIIVFAVLHACGVALTRYDFTINDGGYADLSKGKWILNKPFTNTEQNRVEKTLYKELKNKKNHSITTLTELRKQFIVRDQYAFDMTKAELQSLRKITGYDYLLSVKTHTSRKNQGDRYTHTGVAELKVYDLMHGVLVSYVTGTGEATKFKYRNDDDKADITWMNSEDAIMLNALKKLLSKYKKQKI